MRAVLTVASNYGRFIVGMASVAVVTPAAIAAVGIERFGLWALAAATCGFIALLELGIATTSMRTRPSRRARATPRDAAPRLATLLVAQLPLALAMLLAGWLGAAPLADAFDVAGAARDEFVTMVRIGATAAALVLPLALWRAALAARGHLHLSNLFDACAIAAGAGVSLAGLAHGLGVTALAIGAATTTLLPAPLLLLAVRRQVPDLDLSWRNASRAEWRSMRNFAGAAISTNTANLAAQRLEPVVVNAFLPLGAVSQYSVAARIAEYALLLGRQLSSALTPLVARAHGAGDSQAVRASLQVGTRFQVALMLPFALLLGWHAPSILEAWLGPSALPAALPLRLLCVALALSALAMHPAICLGMTGRHRLVAQAALGGAALRLLLGVVLIAPLGLVGAGIAAIVAALVVDAGVVASSACRHLGIRYGAFLRQTVVPALPGLFGAAVTAAAALEQWHAPDTLGAVLAQSCAAGVAFVVLFLPLGLRGLLPARAATAPTPEAVTP